MSFTFVNIPGVPSDLVVERDEAAGIVYASDVIPVSSLGPTGYRVSEPRSLVVELLAGDEVLVSTDGGVTYPYSLSSTEEILSASLTAEVPPDLLFSSVGMSTIKILISATAILKAENTPLIGLDAPPEQ